MIRARSLSVQGVVQGVGFRPFVYRLAKRHGLSGWVRNGGDGVEIHVEGEEPALDRFAAEVAVGPPASRVTAIESAETEPEHFTAFEILASERRGTPTVRISPDLPVCARCLAELSTPADRRAGYPYINCTDCGPRYSIVLSLPYDRPRTTMAGWPLCPACAAEYHDPLDRRFHAQPVACPVCGPSFRLEVAGPEGAGEIAGVEAIPEAARLLAAGRILAIKGIGGYHLGCDAGNAEAVAALRQRKFRKEKPFALMARDLDVARRLVDLSPATEELLTSTARPIVLAPARVELPGVAPDNGDLGVMLPYAPLHHLLFAHGAPEALVLTSANRSNEPIAYEDDDARERLAGIADAFLVGERPIARRIDDSVATVTALGPAVWRRARGYAPSAVARFPPGPPLLALGADLKSAVTLVVGGEAFVSQHLGDLGDWASFRAFEETVRDLLDMYEVDRAHLVVAHDLHSEYLSTQFASRLQEKGEAGGGTVALQHHRAHVASVLAEHGTFAKRVVGVALDGTGYGDDGSIWGGEIFTGSLREGFERAAHLRPAQLPGGDAAARHPVQAAAGFLAEIEHLPDLTATPFHFPRRYNEARELVAKNLRTFPTTSTGRLFDTAAALSGFTREITFEGQAAIWLEQQARLASPAEADDPIDDLVPSDGRQLDYRPLLSRLIEERLAGRPIPEIARDFHLGLAAGIANAAIEIARREGLDTVVLSGGVFQNRLLLAEVARRLQAAALTVWTNHEVPPNDGGISLGQAALALSAPRAYRRGERHRRSHEGPGSSGYRR